ncbi:HPF/RaiA family ribosome-associated protein [Uliginosibacterium sp. 31-12]|uniref:HPF/RaiA family ribosome-associated protein n=1 Tax=Uliginosibacterium sp. 31-12 TaxID=3062781 RepID=UPI0026E3BE0D|nr:HPF/RaiA family ribosome-associated protein [Uliginosibacterium sp. 31-12]MDO6387548.1 HPF/RaiA family ribosome-associated protein [Uliginosibacterium sp. 31-12]
MKLAIKKISGTPLDHAVIAHIERRAEFALARLKLHVQQVQVGLIDLNGPRGGIDKCCQVQVKLAGEPALVVAETSEDSYAAINRAFSVASHLAARRIERRSHRRHPEMSEMLQVPAIVG